MRGITTALVGSVVLAAPLLAQVTSQSGGYLMRIKWEAGNSYSFKITSATSMPGSTAKPFEMTGGYSIKVKSVKNNVATVDFKSTPIGSGDPMEETMQVDNRGKVLNADSKPAGVDFTLLPVKAIKINETWSNKQVLPSPIGDLTVNTTYRLVGVKKVGFKEFAEVNLGLTSTGQDITGSGHGVMLIDMADGMLFSSNMRQSLKMSVGGDDPVTLPVTVTITRG